MSFITGLIFINAIAVIVTNHKLKDNEEENR